MKSTLSFTLSFFLLFITNFLPLAFSVPHEKVLDSNGFPISSSGEYYIKQLNPQAPSGGGVELDFDGNSECQVAVRQNYNQSFSGQYLKFNTQGSSSGAIFTETPLEITFVYEPYCASSSKWVVVGDSFPAKWVAIGDARDHPRKQMIAGTFKIQKDGEAYKFVFCTLNNTCSNIGRMDDHKGRRLVLADDPFNFALVTVA